MQRAILLLEARGEDAADDYALQKVLSGFDLANMEHLDNPWNAQNQDGVLPRTEYMVLYSDLSTVKKHAEKAKEVKDYEELMVADDEDFYVVGHGGPGLLWTEPGHEGALTDFSKIVTAIRDMVPDAWSGTIKLLTCNSDVKARKKSKSVAKQIEEGWGQSPPPVEAMAGFAYGIGAEAVGSGDKMSVLKPEFDALYNADSEDSAVSAHLLKVAKKNPAKSIELINFNPKRKMTQSALKTDVWMAFVAKMKQIENRMKAMVTDADDALGIRDETDPLAKASALVGEDEWNELAAQQRALFAHFELWA